MHFVTYNIHYAVGWDGVEDIGRIADAVRGADAIVLQEVERHWGPGNPPDQPAALAEMLPEYYWVYGPTFDVDASTRDTDGRVQNLRRQHGIMILSKTPILSCRTLALPKWIYDGKFNMQMGALEAVIGGALGPLRLYGLHLGYLVSEERQVQIQALLAIVCAAPAGGGAWTGHDVCRRPQHRPGPLGRRGLGPRPVSRLLHPLSGGGIRRCRHRRRFADRL